MGIIAAGPGYPLSGSTASGGKIYGFNNIGAAAPVQILARNGSRVSITIHNPGPQDALIYPQTTGTGAVNAPTIAAPGGGFRIFGNGGALTITGECQNAWSALSFVGVNQPLTVMETNV